MIEIKKELNDRPQTDVYAQDIQHVFLDAMKDQLELVLPVVNKIVDNVLALSDYTLSIGQCRGLVAVFEKTKFPLETLYLENCGVDDDELATLLIGL